MSVKFVPIQPSHPWFVCCRGFPHIEGFINKEAKLFPELTVRSRLGAEPRILLVSSNKREEIRIDHWKTEEIEEYLKNKLIGYKSSWNLRKLAEKSNLQKKCTYKGSSFSILAWSSHVHFYFQLRWCSVGFYWFRGWCFHADDLWRLSDAQTRLPAGLTLMHARGMWLKDIKSVTSLQKQILSHIAKDISACQSSEHQYVLQAHHKYPQYCLGFGHGNILQSELISRRNTSRSIWWASLEVFDDLNKHWCTI